MVGGDEFPRPGVLDNLGLEDQSPPFDLREFFGLDPWPPRRSLNSLQRARIASGLSQNELAAELSISRQTVSSIENRRCTPSVRLALAFAIALGSTVEELFAGDELR
jgi:putative transcriptional regulator